MKWTQVVAILPALVSISSAVPAQQPVQSEPEAMYYRYLEFPSYVKGGSVQAHWMADGSSFWYAEGAPANTVIWKVDPRANPLAGLRAGTKTPLFDTARLRQALTPLLGYEPPYQGLPFAEFTFVGEGEKAVKFSVEGKEFILQLDSYMIAGAPVLSEMEKSRLVPQIVRKSFPSTGPDAMEVLSPDRRWFAGVKDYNLWLRSTYDGRSVQMTTDGVKDYEWGVNGANQVKWSPDSFKLAVYKVDCRQCEKVPIVHWLKPKEEVEWLNYNYRVGSPPQVEVFIVDILSKRAVRVDTGKELDQIIVLLGWRPDGSEVLFFRTNPSVKELDLMAANPATGATRVVLTETQKTFIKDDWYTWSDLLTLVEDGKRFIWQSERDGWDHLYLYGLDGTLIQRLTNGTFPVMRVVAVDAKAGYVYFTAHADRQRPYDTHLYRVTLEGKNFRRLTEATGQHSIEFAPSEQFFLDTHSSPDRPPAVELRSADGKLLQTLSKANIDALKELKWSPPEEFVVKAADGKTDLYGLLYKPYDFDPNKKYPVIEYIYAGPWICVWCPRTFTIRGQLIKLSRALAQLGFIVFGVDGRGTPERGKEFQDVVYGNLGRHEIPEHVAVLKQLAEKRPYMDLSRVGIFGHSWGSYFTVRALLLAPDVYHVGVASAIDAELGLWEVTWMGLPRDNKEAYEYGSNLRFAGNLKGKLLLISGTSDLNTPFAETMKMVEALIRAGKPYDLVVLPEQNHIPSGTSLVYMFEAIRRYFQEHLKP